MKKNKCQNLLLIITVSLMTLSSGISKAQENAPITQFPQEIEPRDANSAATSSTGTNKNKTKIKVDFEDQLITGKHDMPEAEMVFTRTQFNYKKMIRLRDNFIPEVKQGKDEFRGRN